MRSDHLVERAPRAQRVLGLPGGRRREASVEEPEVVGVVAQGLLVLRDEHFFQPEAALERVAPDL